MSLVSWKNPGGHSRPSERPRSRPYDTRLVYFYLLELACPILSNDSLDSDSPLTDHDPCIVGSTGRAIGINIEKGNVVWKISKEQPLAWEYLPHGRI
jgi:hypothetical protein